MSQQPLEGLGHRPAGQAPDFQAPAGWPGGPGYTAPSQGRAPYGTSPQPGQPPYGSAGISYAHPAADLQGSAPASPYPAPPYPTAPPPKPDLRWWALGIIGLFVVIGIVTVVVLQQPKRPVAPAAPTPATVTPDRTTTAPRTTAPQTTPTRSTSTATRGPSTATQATAPATRGFTITPPPGWGYATTSGTSNDVRLVDAQGSTLTVYSWASQETGAARCAKELTSLKIWVPGQITPVADTTLAGEPFQGGQLQGEKQLYVLRCAQKNGRVYNLSSQSSIERAGAVASAYDQVVASWAWT